MEEINAFDVEEIQSRIDDLRELDDISLEEFHEKDQQAKREHSMKKDAALLSSLNKLVWNDSLPVDLDEGPYEVTNERGIPLIPCYEKVRENLYLFSDANPDLMGKIQKVKKDVEDLFYCDDFSGKDIDVNVPNRIGIFIGGLERVEPENLALTRDKGQQITDSYYDGKIDASELNAKLWEDHASTYFDSYSDLIDYCIDRGIDIHCVGRKREEYVSEGMTEKVRDLEDKMAYARANPKRYDEIRNKYFRERSKNTDEIIKPKVLDLAEDGKTMLIIGAGHRPNLLNILEE